MDIEGVGVLRSMNDREKLRLLLAHWVNHNLEHAQEFRRWARRAEEFGSDGAASKLEAAAQEMKVLNNSLQAALELLGGAVEENR
jgi:hypothetical protein